MSNNNPASTALYEPIKVGESPFASKKWNSPENPIKSRGGDSELIYPVDLLGNRLTTNDQFLSDRSLTLEQKEFAFRPVISFRMIHSATRTKFHGAGAAPMIILPAPAGLGYEDSGSYDSKELGVAGNIAMEVGSVAGGSQSVGDAMGKIKDKLGNLAAGVLQDMTGAITEVAGNFADKAGAIGAGFNIGAGQAVNKYATTEFTGVGTRSFGFAFKLFPKSLEDSQRIKAIAEVFQLSVYPTLGQLNMLKYPPKWHIQILDGSGNPNKYLPGIYESYLTDCKVNYNGDANNWYAANNNMTEAAPFVADINVTFKESRALTAEDISKLHQ